MRSTLVAALVSCADRQWKAQARQFLSGLSSDELQYIAGFLGTCILESENAKRSGAACPGKRQSCSEDRELKMILVAEYLYRAGIDRMAS